MRHAAAASRTLGHVLQRCFRLECNFISVAEENEMIAALQGKLGCMRWNGGHFDEKIVNYRELTLSHPAAVSPLLAEIARTRVGPWMRMRPLLPLHVLELRRDGEIKAHTDNQEYSGAMIGCLSLQKDATLTLRSSIDLSQTVTVAIPRRSFYWQAYVHREAAARLTTL